MSASGRVLEIPGRLEGGRIACACSTAEIVRLVMDEKRLVLLKGVFPDAQVTALRKAVAAWGRETPAVDVDDFRGNYHRRRAMVARIQQAPHVFHDYNFNALGKTPPPLQAELRALFEPLQHLYDALTGQSVRLEVPESGPYVHPQLLHYPSGGGFFARHLHNLHPQQLGFIVSLAQRGRDFRNGGTVFEIDGEIVDLELRQDVGDICIWRYDHPHWVTQSDLRDPFSWDREDGRWVATFAYFDPFAPEAA